MSFDALGFVKDGMMLSAGFKVSSWTKITGEISDLYGFLIGCHRTYGKVWDLKHRQDFSMGKWVISFISSQWWEFTRSGSTSFGGDGSHGQVQVKSTMSKMVIFHSYVKLPEGIIFKKFPGNLRSSQVPWSRPIYLWSSHWLPKDPNFIVEAWWPQPGPRWFGMGQTCNCFPTLFPCKELEFHQLLHFSWPHTLSDYPDWSVLQALFHQHFRWRERNSEGATKISETGRSQQCNPLTPQSGPVYNHGSPM